MEKSYYDLTAPQKSILLTEEYFKGTKINNLCGTFYSPIKLDFKVLEEAINLFVKNNDSYRIRLITKDNTIKQYICEYKKFKVETIAVSNKEDQAKLEKSVALSHLNIIDSPLFKFVMFRYPDGHGGFIINSHHIISDSWTHGIMADEVSKYYYAILNNSITPKDPSLSYVNYIKSETDYINSEKFIKDKEYWNNIFATIPEVASIPSVKSTSSNIDSIKAKRLLIDFNNTILDKIKSFCLEQKISLYNFFMAVFSIYLGRVSNLDEFVIGTPILNRSNFKEKHTSGMFINILPFKIKINNENSFLNFVKEIATNSMSMLRHQKYSYQFLLEDLRKKDPTIPGLYNLIYSYQITKMNESINLLPHETSWTFNEAIAEDLDIHMYEWNNNNSIKIAYDYKANKYDENDILQINERILHIINQLLENNNILLKNIEIVTPEEKHQIL